MTLIRTRMTVFIALGLCLVLSPLVHAADAEAQAKSELINHADLLSALDAAGQDNGLVFAVFSATWCGPCQKLKHDTLENSDFLQHVGKLHYVYVDTDAHRKLTQQYEVRGIPALLLMSGDRKIVARDAGYKTVVDLLTWIEQGRRRVERGEWEGTALDQTTAFKLASAQDWSTALDAMGSHEPAQRAAASQAISGQRDRAVPHLLDGMSRAELAMRVGAAEVWRQLAPDSPAFDAWADEAARAEQLNALRDWWSKTGKLPAPAETFAADSPEERSVQDALAEASSPDPIKRTNGMAALTRLGKPALPAVRQAIARAVRAGDTQLLAVLEDVRWAILIPDDLQNKLQVRHELARGATDARQAAASKLGSGGAAALPALRELIDDSDPLVRESAVAALTQIGGDDALAAMAVLLDARDSNLRMIAAQELGRTKNAAAARYLVKVLRDPDELVAVVAIAALEETRAVNQAEALIECLSDPRWRVRAAAAETVGKLQIGSGADALNRLLDDEDSVVVRSTIGALQQIGRQPDTAQMRDLVRRLPDLADVAIEMITQQDSAQAVQTLVEMYDEGDTDLRGAIFDSLAGRRGHYYSGEQNDSAWKPLFDRAASSDDPQMRRKLVAALPSQSTKLAAEYLALLLGDADAETRAMATEQVLRVVAQQELLGVQHDDPPVFDGPPIPSVTTNEAQVLRTQWHDALQPHVTPGADPRVVVAFYVTGDGKTDLPVLAPVLTNPHWRVTFDAQISPLVPALVLKRLPWPEGKDLLDQALGAGLYGELLTGAGAATSEVRQYLLDPDRLVAAVEQAQGDAYKTLAEMLVGERHGGGMGISLLSGGPETEAIIRRLCASESVGARTIGAFAASVRQPVLDMELVRNALKDKNGWPRRAAATAIRRSITDLPTREELLGPLLDDSSSGVVFVAAVSLLQPELRYANGRKDNDPLYFHYESLSFPAVSLSNPANLPPPGAVARQPAFLESVRHRLAEAEVASKDPPIRYTFALLLAQYGDNSGMEAELARWEAQPSQSPPDILLMALTITQDPRYLPALKQKIAAMQNDYELRQSLQWLRGVTGAEARELRREINRRIQQAPNPRLGF